MPGWVPAILGEQVYPSNIAYSRSRDSQSGLETISRPFGPGTRAYPVSRKSSLTRPRDRGGKVISITSLGRGLAEFPSRSYTISRKSDGYLDGAASIRARAYAVCIT